MVGQLLHLLVLPGGHLPVVVPADGDQRAAARRASLRRDGVLEQALKLRIAPGQRASRKRSVASTRRCVVPGSFAAWPASGTTCEVGLGPAAVQVPGGRHRAAPRRSGPARSPPGCAGSGRRRRAAASGRGEEAAVDEVVALDPREGDRRPSARAVRAMSSGRAAASSCVASQVAPGRRGRGALRRVVAGQPAVVGARPGRRARLGGIGARYSSHASGKTKLAPSW